MHCSRSTYWKQLEQTSINMDELISTVEGVSFWTPAIMAKDHNVVFADCPKKTNYHDILSYAAFVELSQLLPVVGQTRECKHNRNSPYTCTYQAAD